MWPLAVWTGDRINVFLFLLRKCLPFFRDRKKIGRNNEVTVRRGSTIDNLYEEHLAKYLFVVSPTLSKESLLRHLWLNETRSRCNLTRLMNTLPRLTWPSLTLASLFHVTFQYFCLSIILKRALLNSHRLQLVAALSAVKESTANVVKSICLSRHFKAFTFQNCQNPSAFLLFVSASVKSTLVKRALVYPQITSAFAFLYRFEICDVTKE